MGFFDISSIIGYLIAILIGIFIGVFLPAWYQDYLVKKREKEAFLKKVKAEFRLYETLWEGYFKDDESRWLFRQKDDELMENIEELGKRLVNLATEQPPEIPEELVSEIQAIGLKIIDFGTTKPTRWSGEEISLPSGLEKHKTFENFFNWLKENFKAQAKGYRYLGDEILKEVKELEKRLDSL